MLHSPPPKPQFRPASTVWWGEVEAIVNFFEQTTDSAGHISFLYKLLLPSGITRTVQEWLLKTSTPPAPPPHTTVPTPSPSVHFPYVAPSITPPSLSPPPAQYTPQLPQPLHRFRLLQNLRLSQHYHKQIFLNCVWPSHPKNHLNILSRRASACNTSWRKWVNRWTSTIRNRATKKNISRILWPWKNNTWTWPLPFSNTKIHLQQNPYLLQYQPHQ